MKRDYTKEAVSRYISILNAALYDVRLIHANEKEQPIKQAYSVEQLIRSVDFLRYMNTTGFHIYCRPMGYQFILVDDLPVDMLEQLQPFKPALIVETSPGNHQAWLKLKEIPFDHAEALAICRAIAQYLKADKAAAKPEQVGRLPGFTNRKAKYINKNQLYPFTKIIRWSTDYSSLYPLEGAAVQQTAMLEQSLAISSNSWQFRNNAKSQSEIDFAIACQMIRNGKTDSEIETELEKNLFISGRRKKSRHYIKQTISNARIAVKRQ